MRISFFGPEPVKIIWLSIAVVSLVLTAMILWAGRPAARAHFNLDPREESEVYYVNTMSRFELTQLS